jgi:hypothetical protein
VFPDVKSKEIKQADRQVRAKVMNNDFFVLLFVLIQKPAAEAVDILLLL